MAVQKSPKEFPKFSHHEDARCDQCNRLLPGPFTLLASMPSGKFGKRCPICGTMTWYDLRAVEEEPMQAGLRNYRP